MAHIPIRTLIERRASLMEGMERNRPQVRTRNRQALVALIPDEPRGIVLSYTAVLFKILKKLERLTLDAFGLRADAIGEDITTLDRLDILFEDELGEATLNPIVNRVQAQVELENWRQWRKVLVINPVLREEGLAAAREEFIRANVSLIKSIGRKTLGQMREVIETSTIGQTRVEFLQRTIEERFKVSRSRAALIARDQTLKHNANLSQTRLQAVGITHYIWSTSNDERVRETHAILDGTRQSWDNPPIVSDDGRTEHPGGDFQCRCIAIPDVRGTVLES